MEHYTMQAKTRRKRSTTRPMPSTLTVDDIEQVYSWPLGAVKTNLAAGERWTDCIVIFDDTIRVGGKYNVRRVRYGGVGRFYIEYNGARVMLRGELELRVLSVASHVYGVCKDSDKAHNKYLKGY